ncbi:MAG TPA: hypothetical protein VJN21_03645 [Candidatus Acidoferrales bacterium]|nr:hypothetical protein [Candidatus Acidoferrales bacterium]
MKTLWRALKNTIFWSFERGSWPYDVMVVLIVAFVLLSPRAWFRDEPRANGPSPVGIEFVAEDLAARTQTYRLDARLFRPQKTPGKPGPEIERQTHEILSTSVGELKGQIFQVKKISPVRGDDGSLAYYEVEVKR